MFEFESTNTKYQQNEKLGDAHQSIHKNYYKRRELEAEIAELKESIDMLKYVQNEACIGANAILKMLETIEPNKGSASYSMARMINYVNKLKRGE